MGSRRAAIVLAAGASRRMGTPKALLPWGGSTLLQYAVAQAREAGAHDVVVALGPATGETAVEARTVFNPDPESGRSASLRLAAAALAEDCDAILIQSVDQPVDAHVLRSLFEVLTGQTEIAIPTYQGHRGHPICVAGRLLPELRNVSEAGQGLRAVVRAHAERVIELPLDSPSVVWNLNDPDAYATARAAR